MSVVKGNFYRSTNSGTIVIAIESTDGVYFEGVVIKPSTIVKPYGEDLSIGHLGTWCTFDYELTNNPY